MSSYSEALKAAGAKILEFKSFGKYQGDWWAKVQYLDKTGWVHGSYGSCCGCDAFSAEFNSIDEECDNHPFYKPDKNCPKCQEKNIRLINFGRRYLDILLTQDEAENNAKQNICWDDMEVQKIFDWIRENTLNKPTLNQGEEHDNEIV